MELEIEQCSQDMLASASQYAPANCWPT